MVRSGLGNSIVERETERSGVGYLAVLKNLKRCQSNVNCQYVEYFTHREQFNLDFFFARQYIIYRNSDSMI